MVIRVYFQGVYYLGRRLTVPSKFSRCICLHVPDHSRAAEFYQKALGLEVISREGTTIELRAEPFRLFFDQGTLLGPITEFLVPDVETAKK